MRLLLNIIWFLLAGVWMAIGYTLAALICFILIVTIPFGIASLRIALFALWPFGRTVVRRPDAGIASGIGNVLWFCSAAGGSRLRTSYPECCSASRSSASPLASETSS